MENLTVAMLVRAIELFLDHAYPPGQVPPQRRYFAQWRADEPLEQILKLEYCERLPSLLPGGPAGFALRLGSQDYQHLKLTVQPYARPPGFVFGVDTHDLFRLPPGSGDADAISELQQRNRLLAGQIHSAWEAAGLPTQAGLLRDYLARARARDGHGKSH